MDNTVSTLMPVESEELEYSVEDDIKDIIRQPLVDILIALMLINDIFMFLHQSF
jgi:hypothetical protein